MQERVCRLLLEFRACNLRSIQGQAGSMNEWNRQNRTQQEWVEMRWTKWNALHLKAFKCIVLIQWANQAISVSRLNLSIHLSPYFQVLLASKTSTFVELTLLSSCLYLSCFTLQKKKKSYHQAEQLHFQYTITSWGKHSALSSHPSMRPRKFSIPLSDMTISCFLLFTNLLIRMLLAIVIEFPIQMASICKKSTL